MGEVLQTGPSRGPISRRQWAVGVGVILVVAGAVLVVGRSPDEPAAPTATRSLAATVSPSASQPPATETASAPPWPSAAGACRSTVDLPRTTTGPPPPGINGGVLVGSTGIRQLILGSGRQTAVPGVSGRGGQLVTGLVAGPDADYAATIACDGSTAPRFYRIVGGRAQLMAVPGDQFLVGGAHHAWGARYPVPTTPTGSTPPGPVLTPLDGGRKLQLGSNTWLFADTEAGLIVGRPDPETAGPSQLELADAATGRRVRSLPAGTPMAATGRTLLLQGAGCQNPADPEGCLITRVDLATGRYPMAAERYPDATAVLSANQKVAAFQLGRAAPDLRFEASRLIPPSDIAILHLDTGRLDVVPDLELSPRASAGLALDPTGSTLVAGISLGSRLEVLAWQPGRPAPGLIAHVAGAFDNTRPSILFTGRSG